MKNGETIQICIGTTIAYENTSQGASFINWQFKNGSPSTSGSFGFQDVQYNTAGTDTTFQKVIRGTDTASMFILVKVNDVKPTAAFTFSPNNDCGNVPVVFNSSGSSGNSLTYAWDFNDGSTSSDANPSHPFLNAIGVSGTKDYAVKLVVTNDLNCSVEITKTVTVKKLPDASLGNARSDVIFEPVNGVKTFRRCASLPFYDFQFSNLSTTNSINEKYTIEWGEGSPDSIFNTWQPGTIITHIFPIGKSIMKVTVEGNGCKGIKEYIVFLGTTPAGSLGNIGENSICATKSLTFPIHDFATNAFGTTYRFYIDDGSPEQFYEHPPPDSITHVFGSGSCSHLSGSYTNAYSANLFIENPCGSTSAQIVPLYVSGRPRANLDVYPAYNICANTIATLSNASFFGAQITTTGGTGSTCKNEGKQVWQISPSSGYIITSGDTGSINENRINSTVWDNGTAQVGVRFTTPGTYQVKIFAGNDNCGIDSLIKPVCVRLPPKASFTLDKRTSCAPDTVICKNTSPAPGCLGDVYKWEVVYRDPQNCGITSGYSFINGTGSETKDAAIKFTNAGTYIIKLTVSDAGTSNTCPPATYQDTVLIKDKPKAVINPVSAVCIGNTIAPLSTVNSCYSSNPVTYLWTFANGSPATSSQQVPGNIQYSAIGSYLISLQAENDCGVTTDTDSARITSTPSADAGGDNSICSGGTMQIGSAPSPGITYKWMPAAGLSNSNIADPMVSLSYSGANADTSYEFVVTASAGANCSATDTVKIQVKKNPAVNVSPVTSSVCAGSGTLLTASGADTYTWLPVDGLDNTTGNSVNAAPGSTTVYTATGTFNGCTSSAMATVSVVPFSNVDAGLDTVVCNTSTAIQLSGSPGGGVWSGNAFVSAAGVFNATAAGNGMYTIFYTAGTGTCTKTDSLAVRVINPPVAGAGADTIVCQSNTAIQMMGSPAGGRWTNSSFITLTGSFTPSAAGSYNLIYTIGGGSCIAADTMVITVIGGITNNIINANQSICTESIPAIITGQNATGGNAPSTYKWQSSIDNISWSDIPGENNIDYAPDTLTHTTWYRRVASTTLCFGPESNISNTIQIIVNPDATAEFNPTTTNGCVPFVITPAIINLTPFTGSVSEYRWFVNGNYIGSGQNFPGDTLLVPAASATIRLVAVSSFGCKNDTAEHVFTTVELPVPSFIPNDTARCGPLTISFSNTTLNASRYAYLWDFGQGTTSAAEQPGAITFPINPNYGDTVYTVSMRTISPCDTILVQHSVKVRAQPKALFTPDKTEGCSQMIVTFTNISRGSNAVYVWDFDDGSPLESTNDPIVRHRFITGVRDTFHVKLTGSNDCGKDSLIYKIVVNPNSIKIDFAVNGNERFICAPDTARFINNTTGANSFTWYFGDGDSLVTFKGIDTVIHPYKTQGNFTVKLLATNGCSDTADTELITVALKPAVSFTATSLITCITDTIRFSNTSDAGIAYQWNFGDGTGSSLRDAAKAYNAPGTYRVLLTGSRVLPQGLTCSNSAYTDIVIQDTLPGNFTVSDSVGNCTPFVVLFSNKNVPASQTLWNFGDGGSSTGDNPSHTYTEPGSYLVVMTSQGTSGCIYQATRLITVKAPAGSLSYTGGYACAGNNVRFEVHATDASQYLYVFGDGDSLITADLVASHQYATPGTYIPHAYLIEGACRIEVSTGDTIKADRIFAGISITSQFSCGTTSIQFSDTSYAYFGLQSRQWNFGDGTASSLQNATKSYSQNAIYYVHLAATGTSGCIDTLTIPVDIHVRNFPQTGIGSASVGCTGQAFPMAALITSEDSIANVGWNFGNGATASGLMVTPVYDLSDIYNVRLITATIYGCADTVFKTIQVNASPIVNGGPDVRICRGQSAQLNAFGATVWQWAPADSLSCQTCSNPVANPVLPALYTVTGTNAVGCSITDTILVEVVQPFTITVSPDDTICTGSATQLFAGGATNYLWNPASGLSNESASNPRANPTVTTPYRVIAGDAYHCFADTGYVTVVVGPYPTVQLGTGSEVVAGTAITFNPVLVNGPFKSYAWTPDINLSCSNCAQPTARINNNITYQLVAENIFGCKDTATISYQVTCEEATQVFIPNAFSPDGDNINDVLMVRGKGLAMVKYFRIFNRWGELVFERNNFSANDATQGWNGKVRGIPANPDVYVYTAEIICTAGDTFIKKGNVTLFR